MNVKRDNTNIIIIVVMAFEGDKVMNEFVLVRLLESAYTRQWHLYGQTTYRMGASKARVVFQRVSFKIST